MTSVGTLLGGCVRYRQPEAGFRSGIEPVLLAASVPARAGERVLEGGTGAGPALLCVAARVPGVTGVGVERDPALARCAIGNVRENGFGDLDVLVGDVTDLPADLGMFDHAFANPPYHPEGTASPDAVRDGAKRAPVGLMRDWAGALGRRVRHRGTLTLILPAARLPEALAALAAAGCGSPAVFPLWPRAERAAKLVLLQGTKDGRGPCRLLPGLVLHGGDGSFTEAAERVLRGGEALAF